MIVMLKKMVSQEGFGKRLVKGTKRLSEEIKGSETFAMHVKGLELGGYDCRGLNGQALQFAINNRGGCHKAYGMIARSEMSDGTRLNIEGKGEDVKDAAIGRIIRDSMIVCSFGGHITEPIITEALSAVFGESWSIRDLNEVGMRIMCQERLFNMREGITRKDDTLPARLLIESKPDGPTKGQVVPLDELLNEYYSALGWDIVTGNPTDEVLDSLGIER
jgi:aldehyde:ferredoxin oxidoreductase